MLFDTATQSLRVVFVGLVVYPALVAVLRLSGKRTLSKLNAFDLVVTVALGSTLATTLLSSEVAVAEGLLAVVLLVVAQFVLAMASVRFPVVRRLAKSEPSLLVHEGRVLEERLRRGRVTLGEVRQAVRSNGVGDLSLIAAVILETDGSLSVITKEQAGNGDALIDAVAPAEAARDVPS